MVESRHYMPIYACTYRGELDEWMGRSIDRSTYTHTYMGHVYYMYIDADILSSPQKLDRVLLSYGFNSYRLRVNKLELELDRCGHSHTSYV